MFGIVTNILIGLLRSIFGISKSGTTLTVGSAGDTVSIPGTLTAAAAAGTLTGTTLASNVVTSSLTSLGVQASPLDLGSIAMIRNDPGHVRAGANVTITNTTVFATVLSVTLVAGRTYSFRARVFNSIALANGGIDMQIAGTCTATDIRFAIFYASAVGLGGAYYLYPIQTALANRVNVAGVLATGDSVIDLEGTITVATGGTFLIQQSQNVASANSLVANRGSYMLIDDMF